MSTLLSYLSTLTSAVQLTTNKLVNGQISDMHVPYFFLNAKYYGINSYK